jgi:hypothetical protein
MPAEGSIRGEQEDSYKEKSDGRDQSFDGKEKKLAASAAQESLKLDMEIAELEKMKK